MGYRWAEATIHFWDASGQEIMAENGKEETPFQAEVSQSCRTGTRKRKKHQDIMSWLEGTQFRFTEIVTEPRLFLCM